MTADPIALARSLPAPLDARSRYLRRLTVDALIGGERGHIGSTMSLIEILRVLYDTVLSFRADEPDWPARAAAFYRRAMAVWRFTPCSQTKGFSRPLP